MYGRSVLPIVLLAASLAVAQNVAREPVDSLATVPTRNLLKFLYDITGKQILSGQIHQGLWDKTWGDSYAFDRTGEYPAVYGMDIRYMKEADFPKVVNHLKQMWTERHVIVTVTWHAVQPDKPEVDAGADWNTLHISGYPGGNIERILTPGDDLNKEWLRRIDMRVNNFFKPMAAAGIPIIWRPFHEMNGGWFWWCNHGELYKKLWVQMYRRMVEYHGLHNLLWLYSPNVKMSYTKDYSYNYPGHRYVDMLGHDVYENYGHSYTKSSYDELLAVSDNRPICVAENYKLPPVDMFSREQPRYTFWCVWDGGEACCGNTDDWYRTVFRHSFTMNQRELAAANWWGQNATSAQRAPITSPVTANSRSVLLQIDQNQSPAALLFGLSGRRLVSSGRTPITPCLQIKSTRSRSSNKRMHP